jgi:hypothetical protein
MSYRKDQYEEYIHSLDWENKKVEIREIYRKNNWPIVCIRCGANSNLDLHHNYYSEFLEAAFLSDLDFLCSDCHKQWHSSRVGHIYLTQNYLAKQNLDFYIKDKSSMEQEEALNFLSKKIKKDERIITTVFSRPEFSKYEAYERAGLIEVLFDFVETKEKPPAYDYFAERRKLLKSKNNIIGAIFYEIKK